MSDRAITTAAGSAYEVLKPALRKFVDGYLAGEKASHVVTRLRPKLKRPQELASRWLTRADVKAALAERRQNALEAAGIHQEMIIRELARIAFSNPKALVDEHGNPKPLQELDDDTAAQIAGIELEETEQTIKGNTVTKTRVRKVKRWDKRQALRDLASTSPTS
jgi:phage terminase small subunit